MRALAIQKFVGKFKEWRLPPPTLLPPKKIALRSSVPENSSCLHPMLTPTLVLTAKDKAVI